MQPHDSMRISNLHIKSDQMRKRMDANQTYAGGWVHDEALQTAAIRWQRAGRGPGSHSADSHRADGLTSCSSADSHRAPRILPYTMVALLSYNVGIQSIVDQ